MALRIVKPVSEYARTFKQFQDRDISPLRESQVAGLTTAEQDVWYHKPILHREPALQHKKRPGGTVAASLQYDSTGVPGDEPILLGQTDKFSHNGQDRTNANNSSCVRKRPVYEASLSHKLQDQDCLAELRERCGWGQSQVPYMTRHPAKSQLDQLRDSYDQQLKREERETTRLERQVEMEQRRGRHEVYQGGRHEGYQGGRDENRKDTSPLRTPRYDTGSAGRRKGPTKEPSKKVAMLTPKTQILREEATQTRGAKVSRDVDRSRDKKRDSRRSEVARSQEVSRQKVKNKKRSAEAEDVHVDDNYARRHELGISRRPREPLRQSEYSREYQGRAGVKSSPLVDAVSMYHHDHVGMRGGDIRGDTTYSSSFRPWLQNDLLERARAAAGRAMVSELRRDQPYHRSRSAEPRRRTDATQTDRGAVVPTSDPAEENRLVTLAKTAHNPQEPFFPHNTGRHHVARSEYQKHFIPPKEIVRELEEIRQRAEDHKRRARGSHFSREHMAQILAKQAKLWDAVSTSETLSALSLERGDRDVVEDVEKRPRDEQVERRPRPERREDLALQLEDAVVSEESEGAEERPGETYLLKPAAGVPTVRLGTVKESMEWRQMLAPLTGSEAESEPGRLPTPQLLQLQEMVGPASPPNRHHLDVTTGNKGGTILSSPPRGRSPSEDSQRRRESSPRARTVRKSRDDGYNSAEEMPIAAVTRTHRHSPPRHSPPRHHRPSQPISPAGIQTEDAQSLQPTAWSQTDPHPRAAPAQRPHKTATPSSRRAPDTWADTAPVGARKSERYRASSGTSKSKHDKKLYSFNEWQSGRAPVTREVAKTRTAPVKATVVSADTEEWSTRSVASESISAASDVLNRSRDRRDNFW